MDDLSIFWSGFIFADFFTDVLVFSACGVILIQVHFPNF